MAARLRLPSFGRALPWGLAALSLVLAFLQGDGRTTYVDTRAELTVDPSLFLHRVTAVWSTTVDLGHVQSGQYVGYLFPMGPYFAGADALGIPLWLAERVWLAAILWLCGWGVVLLLDSLYSRRRSSVHLVAAVLYLANPYVVVQANRATGALLAYAALPWILLAAHRGLRDPRGWLWPAAVAVAFASSSGGTNAALVFWVVMAPFGLLVYEVVVLRARARDAVSFAWRAALLAALVSAWWVVPALIAGREAPNFLAFTEQPRAIWSSTSMSESLRLMGYWLSYFQSGFGGVLQPTSSAVNPYLDDKPVIAATFAVPLLAFGGLLVSRRWRYASFFGLLAVGALFVMAAGYPAGKPAAGTLEAVYYHFEASQFLRTTYKAGPLLAIAMACLSGVATARLLALASHARRPGLVRAAGGVALAAVAILFAFPLVRGHLIEPEFAYGSVPGQWRAAMADSARAASGGRRVMVLPGQLFGAYRWGQTVDPPIAPVLTRHPVLQRTVGHYADPRSAQLQEVVDDLVQQGRLTPGQLAPLLELMGVGQVLIAADGRGEQSGESPPATIAEALRDQPGFSRPAATFGPTRLYGALRGQGGSPALLPDLRRYATPGARGRRPVRVQSVDGSLLLEGDADGVAQLAANGGLSPTRALFYAGDLDRSRIRGMVRDGAELVFSDSNRRRRLTPALIRGDVGPTLAARESVPRDAPSFDLFPSRGTAGQTVADFGGLSELRAPFDTNTLSRERRPVAAFDGNLDTSWAPPDPLPDCPCLDLTLRHPRSVDYIRIHPGADGTGPVPLGISVNGGPERRVELSPLGWNRIPIDGHPLRRLRIRVIERLLATTTQIDEVDIPGVRVAESLRLPTWLAASTRGLDLARNSMTVELARTTEDFPFLPGFAEQDRREAQISRIVTLPAARDFSIAGWASPAPDASDSAFDRLAGLPAAWRMDGSSRFEGVPGRRASSAFDGRRDTAWIGEYRSGHSAWLSLTAPEPFRLRGLRLVRGPAEYAYPASVDVQAGGRTFPGLRPGPDGRIVLPQAVSTRTLRLDVTAVDTPAAAVSRRLAAVAVGELDVPGLRVPRARDSGRFETACGDIRVRSASETGTARVSGSLEAMNRGGPMRVTGCGRHASVALPAGASRLRASGSTMLPYLMSLSSPAPAGAIPPVSPGAVVSAGHGGDGSRSEVRLSLRRPAWLTLAESYSPGWRATCRSAKGGEHDLGAPEAIDGFANGWRIDASCTRASFRYAPQRTANVSYVVSALAAIAVLALLGIGLVRRRRDLAPADDHSDEALVEDPVLRLPIGRALALGVALGLLGGWFFAVRAGLVLGIAAAALAWYGASAKRLLWVMLPALVLIPALYLLADTTGAGGHFAYADDHQASHWLAVAAVCALAGACLLDAHARRRESAPGGRGP